MTIFIAIAAYRDADLAATIADCVARARWPADLHFGVCWQFAAGDPPPPDPAPARISRIDVSFADSGGACWARAQALSLYAGEDFVFQIDSHHRFVDHWDAMLLAQVEASTTERPLLTTYAPGFDPTGPAPADGVPTVMLLGGFYDNGVPHYVQAPRPQWQGGPPRRARFVSGHFLFAPARFVDDVPYDPDLYFIGEEISLAVRAFTHGYTLLHPSEPVMWHEYSRRQRVMHWDDHQSSARDAASLDKVARLLAGEITGRYGLGDARSLDEYQAWAGVDFAARRGSSAAMRGTEPPPPPPAGSGIAQPRPWQVAIDLPRDALPAAALDRPAFWHIAFHDIAGVEVARADAEPAEIQRLLHGDRSLRLTRNFTSARPPVRWTLHPTDRHRRWLAPVSGAVDKVPT